MLFEAIVATRGREGFHLAPLGLTTSQDLWVLAPYRPSRSLENLLQVPKATLSFTDDARVFAGLVTGRTNWPIEQLENYPPRLTVALAHAEIDVVDIEDDIVRPRIYCRISKTESHRPYCGFNRARAAVIEACILYSRRNRLSKEFIASKYAILEEAIIKTAGKDELEAWGWIKHLQFEKKIVPEIS